MYAYIYTMKSHDIHTHVYSHTHITCTYTYSTPPHRYLHTHMHVHIHTHTQTHKYVPVHMCMHMHTQRCTHRGRYKFQEVGITERCLRSCLALGPSHEEALLDCALEFLRQEASAFSAHVTVGSRAFPGPIVTAGGFTSRMAHPMATKLVLVKWSLSQACGPGILSPSLSVLWASSQQGGWLLRASM